MTMTMTPHASNPTLAPKPVVLQFAPGNAPSSPRMNGLNVDPLDFFFRRFRLNHSGYQKVLLPVQGFDRCPLGQHQFFGVQTVHRSHLAELPLVMVIGHRSSVIGHRSSVIGQCSFHPKPRTRRKINSGVIGHAVELDLSAKNWCPEPGSNRHAPLLESGGF